jgi:hypothetical protein
MAIGIYFITGMMVGIEWQSNPETGSTVLVLDLFIVRLMFERITADE